MRRAWPMVALILAQSLLVAAYFWVEARREVPRPFAVEALSGPAPRLSLFRADVPVTIPNDRLVLVHFWATWCVPCQAELPALIAAADAARTPLYAVTDEAWPVLLAYFDGPPPQPIVHNPGGAAAAVYGVSGLPETFVVRDGQLIARMGGARDWSTPSAREYLRAAQAERR